MGLSSIQWVSVGSPAVHGPVRPPTSSRWVASAGLSKVYGPANQFSMGCVSRSLEGLWARQPVLDGLRQQVSRRSMGLCARQTHTRVSVLSRPMLRLWDWTRSGLSEYRDAKKSPTFEDGVARRSRARDDDAAGRGQPGGT